MTGMTHMIPYDSYDMTSVSMANRENFSRPAKMLFFSIEYSPEKTRPPPSGEKSEISIFSRKNGSKLRFSSRDSGP